MATPMMWRAITASRISLKQPWIYVRLLTDAVSEEKITHFGYKSVTEDEKAKKVQDVFSSVASSYDIMNDVMSFGVHRLWKDWFVQKLDPPPGTRILDVAGGTGDIAYRILNYKQRKERTEEYDITVLDVNSDMLELGAKKTGGDSIMWIHGDAMALPFPNNSFDAYSIVFGIRNVANIQQALEEAVRILVPGGRFLCMEFSSVSNPILRRLYDIYSFQLIPVFGELIASDRDSYQYLVESIRKFPDQETFADMLQDAGLCHVTYESLSGDIVAIHSGFKLIS